MVDSWEDFDINDESQWPALGNTSQQKVRNSSPPLPQPEERQPVSAEPKQAEGFLSEAGLRSAHPFFESQPVMKILPRKKAGEEGSMSRSSSAGELSDEARSRKTLEQREREYAEARRRILGQDADAQAKPPASVSTQGRGTSSDSKQSQLRSAGEVKQGKRLTAIDDLADYRRGRPSMSPNPQGWAAYGVYAPPAGFLPAEPLYGVPSVPPVPYTGYPGFVPNYQQ